MEEQTSALLLAESSSWGEKVQPFTQLQKSGIYSMGTKFDQNLVVSYIGCAMNISVLVGFTEKTWLVRITQCFTRLPYI